MVAINKRQRSLVCCSSRGHKELDSTELMNNNNKIKTIFFAILSQNRLIIHKPLLS